MGRLGPFGPGEEMVAAGPLSGCTAHLGPDARPRGEGAPESEAGDCAAREPLPAPTSREGPRPWTAARAPPASALQRRKSVAVRTRADALGSIRGAQDAAGPGPEPRGPWRSRAEPSRAEPSGAERSRARPGRAERSRAGRPGIGRRRFTACDDDFSSASRRGQRGA